jgi:hypothetical protein
MRPAQAVVARGAVLGRRALLATRVHPRAFASASSYYEVVGGLKYDKECMNAAREAVAGKGDGRVSKADAETIIAKLVDGRVSQGASGNSITEIEYRTAFRVLHEFNWTPEAQAVFIERLSKV